MGPSRRLIVNADDFGQTPGVNRGVIEAHERGVVTSASLMVRWPAAEAASAYARGRPALGVGLHVDLGEWAFRGGEWVPLYVVVPPDDAEAVRREAAHQLDAFRRLVGRDPTHLDSHQHVHRDGPARAAVLELGRELGVPVRHLGPTVLYCGAFYGQGPKGDPLPEGVTAEALAGIVSAVPPGVTELACHPGYPEGLDSMYREERAAEVRALCDPRVRAAAAAAGVELCTFRNLGGDAGGGP